MFTSPYDGLSDPEILDVLVVGAGISGINCAFRLQTELPGIEFAVLEGRSNIGGTWDLFKYPGVRADTDLHSFGFPWYPWPFDCPIADGSLLTSYLSSAISKYELGKHIRLRHRVVSADWSSESQRWEIVVNAEGGQLQTIKARFMVVAAGYYDYGLPLKPDIPGLNEFQGEVINPQMWPDDFEYEGKKIAVIGSGATAITLFPALAKKAAEITMVQRSPSYIFSGKHSTYSPPWVRKYLPRAIRLKYERIYFIVIPFLLVLFCQYFPRLAREIIRRDVSEYLPPSVPQDPHFTPRYNPWEQRMCFSPGGEFHRTFYRPNAKIVTGRIRTIGENRIHMEDGQSIEVEVIVTATGLNMKLGGDIAIRVDGESTSLKQRLLWNGAMFEGIPNMAYTIGYPRHAWTLGADNTAFVVVRLLKYMKTEGVTSATPRRPRDSHEHKPEPMWPFSSTYVVRSRNDMPVYGRTGPWRPRDKSPLDWIHARWGNITRGLHFSV
ncbi:putative flavin-binding monooxygenase [Durotheca rogersii]|uniref:putative flavin-binding monooxygenase n=1 Tax=Durotheca rogersii TaxID=419775 RepID=UPI00221EE10B|nr:putative flavin-binding monooxygenase [Durotheca rogersii]KAI5867643.1 putative flavin-binding monooxygenase [Durotheca rogersii]